MNVLTFMKENVLLEWTVINTRPLRKRYICPWFKAERQFDSPTLNMLFDSQI